MSECLPCGLRQAANDGMTECLCDGNLYFDGSDCLRCPTGLLCEAFNQFCVLSDFYQSLDGSVFPCKKSGCLGNCTSSVTQCKESFNGPHCSHCEDGFYSQGDLCSKCPDVVVIYAIIASQVFIYLCLIPLVKIDKKRKFQALPFYLPLIRFIQCLCAIRLITAIPLPSSVHYIFDVLDAVMLRPWGSPITACAGLPSGFKTLFISSSAILPCIIVIGLLLKGISISSVFFQIFIAVPAHNLLSVFSCKRHDSSDFFSPFFDDLECFSSEWYLLSFISAGFVIVLVLWLVIANGLRLKNAFTSTFSTLSFSDESIYQIHLLFVVGLLFALEFMGNTVQSSVGFFVCLVTLAITSKRKSFEHPRAQLLQTLYLIVEACMFMLVFVRSMDVINTSDVFVSFVLILCAVLVVFSIALCLQTFITGKVDPVSFKSRGGFATNRLQNPLVWLQQ
ncbi:hypothetical protein GEMRC1_014076 [Eukaryota sp. GEM-RC1]